MTASVRLLTTSSCDSSPAILLVAPDGSKILINCGEGTQRTFLEYSQRLTTVKAVCLTHIGPDATGGLPGMILTLADATSAQSDAAAGAGAARTTPAATPASLPDDQSTSILEGSTTESTTNTSDPFLKLNDTLIATHSAPPIADLEGLDVVGPHGTRAFFQALRHFVRRDRFPVRVHEGAVTFGRSSLDNTAPRQRKRKKPESSDVGDEGPPWSFTVQSVPVEILPTTNTISDNMDRESAGPAWVRNGIENPGDSAAADVASIPARQALSFVITTPPVPGKFLPQQALALGVPKGPLFGQLKNGKSVTFIHKTSQQQVTVESHQVVEPPSPGVAVLVLYYPEEAVATPLMSSDGIQAAMQSTETSVELVIHITSLAIYDKFGPHTWEQRGWSKANSNAETEDTTQHVFISSDRMCPEADPTPFRSAAKGALARSMLAPSVYLIPKRTSRHLGAHNAETTGSENTVRIGRSMLEYILIPRSKRGFLPLSDDNCLENDTKEAALLVKESGALDEAQRVASSIPDSSSLQEGISKLRKGELIFTGTGSALPCKHRNVTGMLLRGEDGNSILLDVGEGTIGQLLRMAHPSESVSSCQLLDSIKAVWISHPHADHHLGLIRLLHERKAQDPILLIAPRPLFLFLEEYGAMGSCIQHSYVKIDCADVLKENSHVNMLLRRSLGITKLIAVPVAHCQYAYAVILEGTAFGCLVYSGDCRPSDRLARAALDADVLIHEATFEDGMEAEAALKRHSTVGEALSIARLMRAKCIILTHFSQRYPKIPPIPTATQDSDIPVIFAFDNMRIMPSSLWQAFMLTPALRLLYPEEEPDKDGEGNDDISVVTDQANHKTAAQVLAVPGLFANAALL